MRGTLGILPCLAVVHVENIYSGTHIFTNFGIYQRELGPH